MRALRRFTVRASLPEPLAALGHAGHEPAVDLAPAHPGPVRGGRSGASGAGAGRSAAAARRGARRARWTGWPPTRASWPDRGDRRRPARYLTEPRWYQRAQRRQRAAARRRSPTSPWSSASPRCCRTTPAAWACWPVTTSRPRPTSGVPLIGVGLLYRSGYFRQSLSLDGWQVEHYPVIDPRGLPLELLTEPSGAPVLCTWRCRATACCTRGSGWPGSAGCRCCCWTPTSSENDDPDLRGGHRPAVRRRPGSPHPAGDPGRHRRRAGRAARTAS